MLTIRRAEDRGHTDNGWLDSRHTFSFGDYYDPRHVAFRNLRVINEDRVQPGKGFGTHGHRDVEIVSYVLEGALAHRDSMQNGSVIVPGDVQRMSAGTGVTHSESNASADAHVHFLQVWLMPSARGIAPSYEQKAFARDEKMSRFQLIASPDGRDGSVTIHADARLWAGIFDAGQAARYELAHERYAWIHVARGRVRVNGRELSAGDGASLSNENLVVEGVDQGEVLVFDLV